MQSQERELIAGLFDRLRPFESQPRDAEAEVLIREGIARQPAAPYLLVQTVLVQEQALKAAKPPRRRHARRCRRPCRGNRQAVAASCARRWRPRPASPAARCCSRASAA
jgi:hypothetical protein